MGAYRTSALSEQRVTGLQLALGLSAFVLGSCASPIVSVRSTSAPERPYRRLVVAAPLTDPQARADVEDAFVQTLVARGIDATPSLALLPPGRDYTADEAMTRLRESGAQAVFAVTLPDAYVVQRYWSALVESADGSDRAPAATRADEQSSRSGGYAPHGSVLSFDLQLMDLDSRKTMWSASTHVPLSEYPLTRLGRTYRWVAGKAVEKLHRDGLVP